MVIPRVVELPRDRTPWDTARGLAGLPHLLFLDSAAPHPERGRYSFVMADPVLWAARDEDAFAAAERLARPAPLDSIPDLPPFQGGVAGLIGYAAGAALERIPANRYDDLPTPPFALGYYDCVFGFDHLSERGWLLSHTREPGQPDRAGRFLERLSSPSPNSTKRSIGLCPSAPRFGVPGLPGVESNFARDGYLAAVRAAVGYVHAGDCFQVNLSQRLVAPLRDDPLRLYGQLRERNPAPFGAYFDLGDAQILSASPERFLQVRDGAIVSRPIKGTRPRSADPAADAATLAELLANPKDRAENVMIVDLLRNDIGRAARFGSVAVPRLCEPEAFRFVHHLVSEVCGELRADRTCYDLLRGAFPGGSVTGAPKVRAMQIIAELEPTARGPYCGSLVTFSGPRTMDSSILIRTLTATGGWLQCPVGGGVVADSDPAREYDETLHKAAGLFDAVAGGVR